MAKEDLLSYKGTVVEILPGQMYRIELEKNGHKLVGYASGRIKKNKIKILAGDKVDVEISPL